MCQCVGNNLSLDAPVGTVHLVADAAVASRYNELARTGDWNAVGEWFVDYWAAPGTWAAMPSERKQNMIAMLPAVVHEWGMVTNRDSA